VPDLIVIVTFVTIKRLLDRSQSSVMRSRTHARACARVLTCWEHY